MEQRLTPTPAGLSVLVEDLIEVHASVASRPFGATGKAATDAIYFQDATLRRAVTRRFSARGLHKSLPWLTRSDGSIPAAFQTIQRYTSKGRRKGFDGVQVEEKIMEFHPAVSKRCAVVSRGACALMLALSLSGLAMARQEQQEQPPPSQEQGQQQVQQPGKPAQKQDQTQQQSQQPSQQADRPVQDSQQQQTPDQQAPATPPQAGTNRAPDGNRPPISRDQVPQNPGEYGQQNPPPSNRPPATNGLSDQYAAPPALLTIPAGTVLVIRMNEPLSSDRNQVGDQFTGVLEQPVVVNGWVVARRLQTVIGQVKSVKKAGRVKGVSELGVELTDVTLVDGQQAPILTELWKGSGGTSHGEDAATIAGGTALGAIVGSAADWGRGAAIGAGAGAVAGIGAVLLTRGRPTILEPESQLTFRLADPVNVDTTRSQQAFWPVSQEDFEGGRGERPRLRAGGHYGYGPGPCGYYYPCYFAPGYVGIYGAYGWWGPGYYGRGFYGSRGFRRF